MTSRRLLGTAVAAVLALTWSIGANTAVAADPVATVQGKVVDAQGDPIEGIQVTTSITTAEVDDNGTTYTAADGTFSLGIKDESAAQTYKLRFTERDLDDPTFVSANPKYASHTTTVTAPSGEDTAIDDVTLRPGARARFKLRSPTGQVLKKVRVRVGVYNGLSDANGILDVAGLPVGTSKITVAKLNYREGDRLRGTHFIDTGRTVKVTQPGQVVRPDPKIVKAKIAQQIFVRPYSSNPTPKPGVVKLEIGFNRGFGLKRGLTRLSLYDNATFVKYLYVRDAMKVFTVTGQSKGNSSYFVKAPTTKDTYKTSSFDFPDGIASVEIK